MKAHLDQVFQARDTLRGDLAIPPIKSAADGAAALAAIFEAARSGKITLDAATKLSDLAAKTVKAFEDRDAEDRIRQLEELLLPK